MIRTFALATAVILSLTACTGSAPPESANSTPSTPSDLYVFTLRHLVLSEGNVDQYSDSDLLTTGQNVCHILENPGEQTFSTNPVDDLVQSGYLTVPAEAVTQYAQKYLCPSAPVPPLGG